MMSIYRLHSTTSPPLSWLTARRLVKPRSDVAVDTVDHVVDATLSRRVLVASPDESLLHLATDALSSFRPGFNVATASKASHALEWLQSFGPHLLILDLELSGPASLLDHLPPSHIETILVRADRPGTWPGQIADGRSVLTRPVDLPTLLAAVHRVNHEI